MQYDAWGNLVRRRCGLYEQHYVWDAENRLISAQGTGPQGRFQAHYQYDALGRRTRKQVATAHGTTETRFLWQGYRLLQEQHDGGQCSTYLYDPNEAWSPLARIDHLRDDKQGEIYWFSTDLNGAPLEVTDVRGNVRWSGHYGSFGEVRHQTAGFTGALQHTALAHQPLRYAGQYADSETGLHYNLFRYYDPQVGRFIVQDPIGLNGGWNLYQYAPNPLGWIDPLGLSCGSMVKKINGRNPSNSAFAGKTYPASKLPADIRGTYPHGVPFNHAGFPDFSRYSIKNTRIELGSSRNIDFGRADRAAGYGPENPRPEGYTWHHHQDSGYMQLVPTDIHDAVRHSGGISTSKR